MTMNSSPSHKDLVADCTSSFSGDFYGLGVRLGIYCTWLTSWLANNYVKDEICGAQDANAIFLLALIAALIRGTVAPGGDRLKYIDGLMLMHLCSGYIFGCFSIWGYRTVTHARQGRKGLAGFGGFGTHCRLALATAISLYGCWFWSHGIEHGLAFVTNDNGSKKDQCYPLKTFFFAKLDAQADHGIRIWYILTTVLCSIYFGSMLIVALVHRVVAAWKSKEMLARGKGVYATGLTDAELRNVFLFCRWGNLAWIAFAIIMVEMTLVWNNVSQVVGGNGSNTIATPSQLLPLLIGLLGLIRILYLIFRARVLEPHRAKHQLAKARPAPTGPATKTSPADPSEENVDSSAPTPGAPRAVTWVVEDADVDVKKRSTALRYLVAWLPWLSLTPLWTRGMPAYEHIGKLKNSVPARAVDSEMVQQARRQDHDEQEMVYVQVADEERDIDGASSAGDSEMLTEKDAVRPVHRRVGSQMS